MTGKHRVSHLAIMMNTVEVWFFKMLRIRGTWGAKSRLPVLRGEGPRSWSDAEGGIMQPEGRSSVSINEDDVVTVTQLIRL
jgi:hypothetical protein